MAMEAAIRLGIIICDRYRACGGRHGSGGAVRGRCRSEA
jgi:hypothetical protein